MPGLLVGCVGTGLFNPAVVAIALGSAAREHERPRRGHERRVPPGRDRGRRRRVRRDRARRRRRSARGSPTDYVDGLHYASIVGAALAAGRSDRLLTPLPRRTGLVQQAPGRRGGRRAGQVARPECRPASHREGPPRAGLQASGPRKLGPWPRSTGRSSKRSRRRSEIPSGKRAGGSRWRRSASTPILRCA